MDDTYEYTPFTDTNSIRLLFIQPATDDYLLTKCQLRIVNLDDLPPFEALSYTWGNPERSHQIFIDGKRLLITSNLIEALVGVRKELEVRVLWVDAICINQTDVDERTQQVQLMSTIYHKPTDVLIWLGSEDRDTIPALTLLKKMFTAAMNQSSLGEDRLTETRLPSFNTPEHWDLPSFDQPEWQSLIRFFLRAWFTRVWIVQEVRVASSATVFCGKIEADWALIYIASSWFSTNNYMLALNDNPLGGSAGLIQLPNRIGCHRLNDKELYRLPLSRILRKIRGHSSTDPRDKVFALVNLSVEAESRDQRLMPNYSKSMAHAYRDVSRYLIEQGSLDILSAVSWVPDNRSPLIWETTNIPYEGGTIRKTTKVWGPPEDIIFPSWVPRWDSQDHPLPLTDCPEDKEVYSASGGLLLNILRCSDEDALILRGITFDTTNKQTDLKKSNSVGQDPLEYEEYEAWRQIALQANFYPPETRLAVYHTTLTAGLTLNRKPVESDSQHHANLRAFEARMARDGGSTAEPDQSFGDDEAEDYMQLVGQRCGDRRLFTTSKGYVGLGPRGMLPCDTVCILFGGLTPYILRKEGTSFRFIGECYVHGIMHGEAVEALKASSGDGEIIEIR